MSFTADYELKHFYSHFEAVTTGDVLIFDYIPNVETRFTFKNQVKGVLPGSKFYQALLKVWIGEVPATHS